MSQVTYLPMENIGRKYRFDETPYHDMTCAFRLAASVVGLEITDTNRLLVSMSFPATELRFNKPAAHLQTFSVFRGSKTVKGKKRVQPRHM